MLAQCYDGASVMSGKNGGVQKIMQERLGKEIPYVHCFNHQMHLVVVHAIAENSHVEKFFGTCNSICKFLQCPKIAEFYEGTKFSRLLDQRWSGHLMTTNGIIQNWHHLVNIMDHCEEHVNDSELCVQAGGLMKLINSHRFMFIAHVIQKLLTLISPGDKYLQSRDCDVEQGMRLISAIRQEIQGIRFDADNQFLVMDELVRKNYDLSPEDSKRRRKLPNALKDSVVLSSVGSNGENNKQIFIEILDNCLGELDARFGERNSELASSLSSLWPSNPKFMDTELLQPLANLLGLTTTDFEAECVVAKAFLLKEFDCVKHKCFSDICSILFPLRSAFPVAYKLFAGASTLGVSTAVCEASFSTLTRMLTPYRRSMAHQRKRNLVLLSFLSTYTKSVDFGEILKVFSEAKNRRLQLF